MSEGTGCYSIQVKQQYCSPYVARFFTSSVNEQKIINYKLLSNTIDQCWILVKFAPDATYHQQLQIPSAFATLLQHQ